MGLWLMGQIYGSKVWGFGCSFGFRAKGFSVQVGFPLTVTVTNGF